MAEKQSFMVHSLIMQGPTCSALNERGGKGGWRDQGEADEFLGPPGGGKISGALGACGLPARRSVRQRRRHHRTLQQVSQLPLAPCLPPICQTLLFSPCSSPRPPQPVLPSPPSPARPPQPLLLRCRREQSKSVVQEQEASVGAQRKGRVLHRNGGPWASSGSGLTEGHEDRVMEEGPGLKVEPE